VKGNSGWDQLANIEKLISAFWIILPFHPFIIAQQYTAHAVAGSLLSLCPMMGLGVQWSQHSLTSTEVTKIRLGIHSLPMHLQLKVGFLC